MLKTACRFLLPFSLSGLAGTVIADAPPLGKGAAVLPEFRVQHWTSENGLPQNTVKALLQTSDGYLWIGTLYGLARFDGKHFKVFDQMNTPAMTSDAIDALAEDRRDGGLWVGTADALLHYRDHRFERFGRQQGVAFTPGQVWPSRGGGVWLNAGRGEIARFRAGQLERWLFGPESPGDLVVHVVERSAEELLVIRYSGLYRGNLVTRQATRLGPPVPSGQCQTAWADPDATLWVGTSVGVWHWQGTNWTLIPTGDLPLAARLVFRARDGQFWAGLSRNGEATGLSRFASGQFRPVNLEPPDAGVSLTCLDQDLEGSLWIGTSDGLFQLQPRQVQVYSRAQGLRSDDLLVVAQGQDQTIWLGTAVGLSALRAGRIENIAPPDAAAGWSRLGVLLAGRQNRLWVPTPYFFNYLTHYRLSVFAHDRWTPVTAPSELDPLGGVKSLYEDHQGRHWIGTDHGVLGETPTGWQHYPLPGDASGGDVRAIHQDRHDDLWFGTYGGGLHRLHEGVMTSFTTANGPYNNRAWWIHEDADGVFWVASQNGLNRFVPPPSNSEFGIRNSESKTPSQEVGVQKAGSRPEDSALRTPHSALERSALRLPPSAFEGFFTFTTRHGLQENVVNHILEDDFGNLWLSGIRGIYRVSRRELNEVAAGQRAEVRCLALGEADGMLSSECNGGENQPAGCKAKDGRLWFPTAKGVVVIDPKLIHANDVPPHVVIEQIRADDEVVYGDDVTASPRSGKQDSESRKQKTENRNSGVVPWVTLPPGGARALEVRYTANSFAAPGRLRFKYRLAGHDLAWRRDDENRRVALYTDLRPGNYVFQVTACNNHGLWSKHPVEFAFALQPHFYETWLFYLLCGVGLVGLAAVVQAYRLQWQRRLLTLQQRQALADERTRIARDLHDDLGTALTGAALELEVLRREEPNGQPVTDRLRESAGRLRSLAERMREVVWAINPRCDTVSSLASFLEQQAAQFLRAGGLQVRLDFPEEIPALPLESEVRHQLALAVREALTNVVRHAQASEVELSLRLAGSTVLIQVKDNGRGFDPRSAAQAGHGLENLRHRLELVGGGLECQSCPGGGTTLTFHVPAAAGARA